MPPVQCPECGRFLKKTFVTSLSAAPASCPGCAVQLLPEMFGPSGGGESTDGPTSPAERAEDELHGRAPTAPSEPSEPAAPSAPSEPSAESVRPPDLPPEEVRDPYPDVLSGWDPGVGPALDGRIQDRPPFPVDAAIVAGAGVAGLLLGAAVGRDRRPAAAALGAAAGVIGAAVVRRVWHLDV